MNDVSETTPQPFRVRLDGRASRHAFDPAWAPGLYLLTAGSHQDFSGDLTIAFPGTPTRAARLPLSRTADRYVLRLRRPVDALHLDGWSGRHGQVFLELKRVSSVTDLALRLFNRNKLRSQRFRISPDEYAACLTRDREGALAHAIARNNEQVLLRQFGLEDGSDALKRHPEIDEGWNSPAGTYRPSKPPRDGAIGVVLHLHFTELWPEIDACLRKIGHPFDLHVTIPEGSDGTAGLIRRAHPSAQIHQLPNRGRDVGPFFELLAKGCLDRYRYVLKIHGKMSGKDGEETLLGRRWRRAALVELLTAPDRVQKILDRFDECPKLGLVGPSGLRIPNLECRETLDGNRNAIATLNLAERLGADPETLELDYFGGTMFWVRPEALAPMRRLGLRQSDFPDEDGQADGTLQHALERLFVISATLAGYVSEDTEFADRKVVTGPIAHAAGF